MKTAFICPVSAQDGAYLTELVLEQGYPVQGASRDARAATFANHVRLGVRGQVRLEPVNVTDLLIAA